MKKHDSLLKLISLIIVSTFLWSSFASAAGYPLAAERNCLAAASQVPVITPQARVMAAGQKAVVELPIGSPAEFYCQARSALRAGTISDFLGSKSLLMTDMADGSKTAAYTVEPHSAGGRALSRITRTREVNDPLIQLIMSCWPGFNFAVRQFSKGGQTYFQQIIVIDNQLADSFFQSLLNLLAERLGEVRPHSLIQQDSGLAARAMNRENQNPQLQPFGPTGWYPEYYSLADYFDSSYEMSLELTTREIKHKKEDPDADKRKFARMIVHCLKDLDTITSNGPLEEYWQTLTGRADNQNLVIKVNDRLTHNCVRYFNPISKQTEFVFSKNFVDTLVNDYEEYPGEVLVVLLERFFHELGHTGLTSYYQTLEEEYQLLKMDIELQKNLAAAELQEAVSNYFSVRQPSFVSGYYFGLIQMLVDHELREDTDESILALFDRLIATVAALEGELNELYLSADEYAIDKDSSEARDKRIQLAYEETDPEKAGSLINRLRQLPWLQGTFLATYLDVLKNRSLAAQREFFLFLEKRKTAVIPLAQLKTVRVPGVQVPHQQEGARWARQYYGVHRRRRFSDGIGVTEAENGRGMQQRWHKHDTTQEITTSICDNTRLKTGHELAVGTRVQLTFIMIDQDEETQQSKIEIRYEQEEISRQINSIKREYQISRLQIELLDDREPVEIELAEIAPGRYVLMVIDNEMDVPFGHVVEMPKNTFHTLSNNSATVPSVDFTVKDPLTQLIKTYEPPEEMVVAEVAVRGLTEETKEWGNKYVHNYGHYYSDLLIDEQTGEMYQRIEYSLTPAGDKVARTMPIMYRPVEVTLELYTVKREEESERIPFTPFQDGTQVIRIFPWPRQIPEDAQAAQDDHAWVIDRDAEKLQAEVIIYHEEGHEVERLPARGGDLVLLDASLREKYGNFTFRVRNLTETVPQWLDSDNTTIMFFTMVPQWDLLEIFKNFVEFMGIEKNDVQKAIMARLSNFLGELAEEDLIVCLEWLLTQEEEISADVMANFIRSLIEAFPQGLAHFGRLQQKFMVYSGPPAGGKGEVMDATFERGIGRFSDIIGKLILYHTREPRLVKGEKDGVKYHFRVAKRLTDLEQDGDIITAIVNLQLQGLAKKDYTEEGVVVTDINNVVELKEGDEIVGIEGESLIVIRETQEVTLPVYISGMTMAVFLPGDIITSIDPAGNQITVERNIKGLSSVFSGEQPVILEGGYGWFLSVKKQFPDATTAFICPFTDDEIEMRLRNMEWITKEYAEPWQIMIAQREMMKLIEENRGELLIAGNEEFEERIREQVEIEKMERDNAALIESKKIINDLDLYLRNYFDKPPVSPRLHSLVRALAYEMNSRLSARDGYVRLKDEAEGVERYHKVLEAIIQILYRGEYGTVLVLPQGISEADMEKMGEQFAKEFFLCLIEAVLRTPQSRRDKICRALLREHVRPAAMSARQLAVYLKRMINVPGGLQKFGDLEQKMFLFSGPPEGGKRKVLEAIMGTSELGFEEMLGKLLIYHTRKPADRNGRQEKDGVDYHFREEARLRELAEDGQVITAWINRQLQGLAKRGFLEEEIEIINVEGTDRLQEGDIVFAVTPDGMLDVSRAGERELLAVSLTDQKRGMFVPGDLISSIDEEGGRVTVSRKIKGLDSVFSGGKPVLMEGGYGWFLRVMEKYPEIPTVFISPFSDEDIALRQRNMEWMRREFTQPWEKMMAQREMFAIIAEVGEEIDIEENDEYKQRIKHRVMIEQIEEDNARMIEEDLILDFNHYIHKNFGKPVIRAEQHLLVQALGYEVSRRLFSRDGYLRFNEGSKGKDRYNRVMEGVIQILYREEYGKVFANPWQYTKEEFIATISDLRERFAKYFLCNILRGVRDNLAAEAGGVQSPISRKGKGTEEKPAGEIKITPEGSITESADVAEEGLRLVDKILRDIRAKWGVGVFGVARKIRFVDNLGGLRSDEEGTASEYRHAVREILVDIDALKDERILFNCLEHELVHSIGALVQKDESRRSAAVMEAAAEYISLLSLLDLEESSLEEVIANLSDAGNGLDSQGFAQLLRFIVDKGITDEDQRIALVISYILTTTRYAEEAAGFQEILGAEVEDAGERIRLAMAVYGDLIKATEALAPVVKQVKEATASIKAVSKVKMIMSGIELIEMDLMDSLLVNGKFVRIDIDELAKPGNKYILEWLQKISAAKEESPFIFYSTSGTGVSDFVDSNSLVQAQLPADIKAVDVIDLIEPVQVNDQLTADRLYLPLPYSVSGIYLAAQVVLAEGDVKQIQDKLAFNTLRALFMSLGVEEAKLNALFRTPWLVLPPVTKITESLNALRQAIIQVEKAA